MPFKEYSRDYFPPRETLVHYLCDFAIRFHLKVQYGVRVSHITRDGVFQLQDTQGNHYQCQRLIVATGISKPYIPPIPGIEHAELYTDVSVNSDDFVNQRVLIIGKGNSAFETADNLISTAALIHLASPHPITMAWKSHYVGHLRAVNNNLLDTYQLKSQNAIVDATVERIEYTHGQYTVSFNCTHASGEQESLRYDRVIVCTGFRFDASLFAATCRPRLAISHRFPEQTSAWESTNVQDLYFAGTLMQMRDYKRSASGFIHGFRYNVHALARILAHRYHGEPWPSHPINGDAASLADYVIARVNKTSSLWQQFGFLCDVIVLGDQAQQAQCYEDMPIDYVHDTAFRHNYCYYTITLEFGSQHVNDPFHIDRVHKNDSNNAHKSHFLHPIVRRFDSARSVSEHHIIENIEVAWYEECHINPLIKYFQREISTIHKYNEAA
jgi:thioredoxin reductase